jgi:hypothetical protein
LQESETAIPRIVDENFGANPKPADIEMVPHVEERNLLNQLQQLKVGSLRNVVVHQHARRPRRAEVEECLEEEIEFLYRVKDTLTVFTFDYWSMLRNTGLTQ